MSTYQETKASPSSSSFQLGVIDNPYLSPELNKFGVELFNRIPQNPHNNKVHSLFSSSYIRGEMKLLLDATFVTIAHKLAYFDPNDIARAEFKIRNFLSPELEMIRTEIFNRFPQEPHYNNLLSMDSFSEAMMLMLDALFVKVTHKLFYSSGDDTIDVEEIIKALEDLKSSGYDVKHLEERLDLLA